MVLRKDWAHISTVYMSPSSCKYADMTWRNGQVRGLPSLLAMSSSLLLPSYHSGRWATKAHFPVGHGERPFTPSKGIRRLRTESFVDTQPWSLLCSQKNSPGFRENAMVLTGHPRVVLSWGLFAVVWALRTSTLQPLVVIMQRETYKGLGSKLVACLFRVWALISGFKFLQCHLLWNPIAKARAIHKMPLKAKGYFLSSSLGGGEREREREYEYVDNRTIAAVCSVAALCHSRSNLSIRARLDSWTLLTCWTWNRPHLFHINQEINKQNFKGTWRTNAMNFI